MWSSNEANTGVMLDEFEQPKNYNLIEGYKVIQIHPTLQCNLKCRHCYSSSSPGFKASLDLNKLKRFLEYAYNNGFNAVSVSGGEPFLYKDLHELLKYCKSIGYTNLVATNGMLLKSVKAQSILEYIDLAAVSIDGPEEIHDNIRAFKGAYDKMLEGVEVLRKHDVKFGFIHTVTPYTWSLLFDMALFARDAGAKLFQIHPLELYGRAKEEFEEGFITQDVLSKSYILGSYLQAKYASEMAVQMDFLHKDYIKDNPNTVSYYGEDFCLTRENFAAALQTIIIDQSGAVLPISYGFSNLFSVGNINSWNGKENLFEEFIDSKWKNLYILFKAIYEKIVTDEEVNVVPWSEMIVTSSYHNFKVDCTET